MNRNDPVGREAEGIGERVRRLREMRGWRLFDLAYHASVSPSYLSRVERGESVPGLHVARQLAQALDVPLTELLGEAEPPTKDETLEALIRRVVEQEGADPRVADELVRQFLQYVQLPYEVRHQIYRYATFLAGEEGALPDADGQEAHERTPPAATGGRARGSTRRSG